MEQIIEIFEPLKSPWREMALPLLSAVLLVIAQVLQLRNKNIERNRRIVFSMLLFFGAVIALLSAGGIAINAYKFQRVTVSASAISIGKKEIPYSNLRGYLIREDREQSWVNSDIQKKAVRSLVLEEKNGKTYLLPEEYYELSRLIATLDAAFSQWKEVGRR